MKIAVTYEDGLVFGHFGKTRQFKMYETDGEKVLTSQVVETGGSGHSAWRAPPGSMVCSS